VKKEYEILKPKLTIAVNMIDGVSLGDLQKYAREEFGSNFDPNRTKVEVRNHCVIIDKTNAYHPASKETLDQLMNFELKPRRRKSDKQ
jgi:hypothetical protein